MPPPKIGMYDKPLYPAYDIFRIRPFSGCYLAPFKPPWLGRYFSAYSAYFRV
ncbi:hypothetical protein GGP83_002776 [Salinibacter ruber]|uniref:Uncharacterized protein n=1 Tax=Salinibacter ruber TaxID=146919 RepID=A0A9X2Z5G7_9BACT|nr:hypothetical protein [Salinibacter ruber]